MSLIVKRKQGDPDSLDLESCFTSIYEWSIRTTLIVRLTFFNDNEIIQRYNFRFLRDHIWTILEPYTKIERMGCRAQEFEVVELVCDCLGSIASESVRRFYLSKVEKCWMDTH